jgi:hypothetical protein
LKTKHLNTLLRRIFDKLHLIVDVRFLYLLDRSINRLDIMSLYQPAFNYSGHISSSINYFSDSGSRNF